MTEKKKKYFLSIQTRSNGAMYNKIMIMFFFFLFFNDIKFTSIKKKQERVKRTMSMLMRKRDESKNFCSNI